VGFAFAMRLRRLPIAKLLVWPAEESPTALRA